MQTQRIVLVLGANGRFGRAVAAAFAEAGWRVRAQSRQPLAWPLGARVEAVGCDALDETTLIRAAAGAQVVVNALNPPYPDWAQQVRPLAHSALRVAEASGALLMFPGNVYNFGRDLPAVLRLDTPQIADTQKGAIRIDIERSLRQAATRGVNSVTVRAGDYFGGSGRGAWFDLAIAKSIEQEKVVYPGPLDVPHAWAYLPDLARVFVRLAEREWRGAHCFHFAGHTLTGLELHQELQRLMDRQLRLATLPWGMVRLAGLVSPMLRATLEMRYLWQRPHQLDDTALRACLGAVPQTPIDEALGASLTALGVALPASLMPMAM